MRALLIIVLLLITLAVGALATLVACYTCTLPPIQAVPLPQTATPADNTTWSARTLIDLAAARKQLWDNTPVPYDAENPHYARWGIEGFAEAGRRAGQVTDRAGYFYTLAAYINGFRDPHIQLSLEGDQLSTRWPGFIVSRAGDVAEVVYRDAADANAPPQGAKIVACDGKPLTQLLDERVYPFRLDKRLADDRRIAMSRLFLDRGNPFAPAPSKCTVQMFEPGWSKGTIEITLAWRNAPPTDDPWWEKYQAAGIGPKAEWGLSEPAPGVTWIGVPTFSSDDENYPKLDALIKAVEAKGAAMRNGRAIVIDTRGNGGGNSSWADKLAAAIFTQEILARHKAPGREQAVDWRASEANAAYWQDWSDQMAKEFGAFSMNRFGAFAIAWQTRRIASANPPMWRMGSCKPGRSGGLTKQRPRGTSPFPARVYVLSNGSCASSCLNFADTVLMVPGVTVLGSATSADGAYMEVRSEKLPSGEATVTFPQKVERGAGRAPGEAYEADIPYNGLWSDEAVRKWVLARVSQ
ncbi:MAG: S41 family peptidase [Micropepsaceae bacterium]